ncbi:hypothetical protein Q9R32_15040 [Actinotalea sp. AC32]|nr:hypothetical protein [Actinotalea sp. AC32]
MTRRAALPGALALLLALAACGGGSQGPDDGTADDEQPGPLQAYFEQIYGAWDEESSNAQQMRVEEITAECMTEQGFEYVPVDWSQAGGGTVVDEDLEWGTPEFAAEYGYGITTQPGATEEPLPQEPVDEFVDPNSEYVEAMTDGEREAYYLALHGDLYADETSGEEVEYDWTRAGCQGAAQHEVYESTGLDAEQTAALEDEMSTMWESIQTDPRITGLDEEWSSCLADKGFTGYAKVGDPETQLSERSNAVYEEVYGEMDQELTEDEYAALEEEVQARLAELTAEEIEIAVADVGCREEVRYDEVQREVSTEYEQEFVDAHKDELDAWVEAAEAARE